MAEEHPKNPAFEQAKCLFSQILRDCEVYILRYPEISKEFQRYPEISYGYMFEPPRIAAFLSCGTSHCTNSTVLKGNQPVPCHGGLGGWNHTWLVVEQPLWKIWVSWDSMFPTEWTKLNMFQTTTEIWLLNLGEKLQNWVSDRCNSYELHEIGEEPNMWMTIVYPICSS